MFKKIIACLLLAAALFTLLPACGEKTPEVTVKDVPIRAVSQKVLEAFGDEFTGDTEIDAAYLADTYGVKAEWVEDFIGLMPMISFDVDLFIAVKAKDGQADAVEAALKDYYEFITADAAKYPLNFAKIRATKVYRLGDYVFFLQMGVIPEDVKQNNEEEAYNIAVANNQKAIDAINAVLIEEAK